MKKKVILTSILTIALCLSLIAGSTFALFTSESKVNIAVTSGQVEVTAFLKAGSFKAYSKDVEVSADNATEKTFENGGTATVNDKNNVLTIDKITPMDKVEFVVELTNNSNVAIQYQTVISSQNTVVGEDGTKLLDGLNITVDGIDTIKVGNNAVTEWKNDFAEGEKKEIKVSIELPADAGNEYQNLGAEITYTVNAVQGNATVENPVEDSGETYIYTVADLKDFAASVNEGTITYAAKKPAFKLMANIDLNNEEWTPIGNSTNKFTGNFDGGNFTISNLKITGNNSYVGLFGYTVNGEIKNLKIHNADVSGRLGVGVVAGSPYTSTYDNITLTGDVKVNGMSYVGGVVGRNAYANLSNITVNVNAGSYVKANSVEDGIAYRTYVGGVVGFMGEGNHVVSNVVSNIDVIGTTCDIGGVAGIAHYGNTFRNCISTGNVTITDAAEAADAEEIGGIAGVWHNQNGTKVVFENCAFEGTLTSNLTGVDLSDNKIVGKAYSSSGTGELFVNGYKLVKTAEELAALLTSDAETIGALLANDIELPISSLGTITGGSGEYKLGGDNTTAINIDLGGNKLTITTTYWSILGAKNADATMTVKNGTMTSSQASGTWNSYDLSFANCNLAVENVAFEKAIALEAAGKTATLTNVTINETHDYYAIWITAEGQTVNLDNVTINSAGRGIKIDEQYVGTPAKVTLNVKDSKITSANKAAILVKSVEGADINIDNLNISAVAKDTVNAVWVDADSSTYADKVTVTGGTCILEP